MITREQYLADSNNLHHAYYLEIAQECGVAFTDAAQIVKFARALRIDEHMNNIPLNWWDARALGLMTYNGRAVRDALKRRGDFYSLAGGVCLMKAAAREAVRQAAVAAIMRLYGKG